MASLFCNEITALQAKKPTCIDDYIPWSMRMIDLLVQQVGCANERCSYKEVARIDEGVLASDFLTVGWPGDTRPPYALAKFLYVHQGCNIFIAVNDTTCDFASGLAWNPVGNGNITPTAQLVCTPEEALTPSGTFTIRPVTYEWTEMFNNGIEVATGTNPRIDFPLLAVPTHCFQVGAGLHNIEVNVGTQYVDNNSTLNVTLDVQLFDVTANAAVFTQQRLRVTGVDSTLHHFNVFENHASPHIYCIKQRISHIPSSGFASSAWDEVIIRRQH